MQRKIMEKLVKYRGKLMEKLSKSLLIIWQKSCSSFVGHVVKNNSNLQKIPKIFQIDYFVFFLTLLQVIGSTQFGNYSNYSKLIGKNNCN